MRIVIAPDKFKSSLDAPAVASAIAEGLKSVAPSIELDLCPVADGGDGTVAALAAALGGIPMHTRVVGPLPEMMVDASFALSSDHKTAFIEMSAASGLRLLFDDQKNPSLTTTFGTGQLMMAAVESGVTHIVLGLGGSATLDCGIGCAQACGLPVLMEDGEPTAMTEPLVGADLERVLMVKHGRGSPIERIQITAACDVDIPIYGPTGAPAMFGPQKGATPQQVEWFDRQLRRIAARSGQDHLTHAPGTGAAGGMGFAMAAFFGATLRPGFDYVAEVTGLRHRLASADLCITGEGRLDADSLRGKAAIGVARLCREAGVPCIALVGSAGPRADHAIAEGLTAWFSIADGPMSEQQSVQSAPRLLAQAAANVLRLKLCNSPTIG
jgi:glycerate kinase